MKVKLYGFFLFLITPALLLLLTLVSFCGLNFSPFSGCLLFVAEHTNSFIFSHIYCWPIFASILSCFYADFNCSSLWTQQEKNYGIDLLTVNFMWQSMSTPLVMLENTMDIFILLTAALMYLCSYWSHWEFTACCSSSVVRTTENQLGTFHPYFFFLYEDSFFFFFFYWEHNLYPRYYGVCLPLSK